MRYIWFAVIVIGCFTVTAAPAMAQNKTCLKDATRASIAIWPAGSVGTGKQVTGRHPCGRSMECLGGTSARQGGGRNCRWL